MCTAADHSNGFFLKTPTCTFIGLLFNMPAYIYRVGIEGPSGSRSVQFRSFESD